MVIHDEHSPNSRDVHIAVLGMIVSEVTETPVSVYSTTSKEAV